MAVLFDTQAYHRTLTNAGVPSDQADAHMRALEAALVGGVATKQDILALDQKMDLMSRDLKIWTGGIAAASIGLIIGVLKLL